MWMSKGQRKWLLPEDRRWGHPSHSALLAAQHGVWMMPEVSEMADCSDLGAWYARHQERFRLWVVRKEMIQILSNMFNNNEDLEQCGHACHGKGSKSS